MLKSKVPVGCHCELLSKECWGHASEQRQVKRLERISPEMCRVLRLVKPGTKGGVDIEAALSQEGWTVRAVEEGKTWEKLARAIEEFQKGNSGFIGWDGRAAARKPVCRVPQTIFPSSGSNYLSHRGC